MLSNPSLCGSAKLVMRTRDAYSLKQTFTQQAAAAVPVVSEVETFDDDYFYTHTATLSRP